MMSKSEMLKTNKVTNKLINIVLSFALVFLLFGCSEKILVSKLTNNIKIYEISDVINPKTDSLIEEISSMNEISILVELFNHSKKFKLNLDTSIYNRMAILMDGDKVQTIFYVVYPNSQDGYFIFAGQNITYQFTYKTLSQLINSDLDY